MLDRVAGRVFVSLMGLSLSGHADAVGLGDMRGQAVLGESIKLEIALLGAEKLKLDAGCFRLAQPQSNDGLPWLRKASLTLRNGASPVLEIRSDVPLREPVMQLTLQLGCGHEVSRDYILLASPSAVSQVVPHVAPARMASAADTGVSDSARVDRRPPRTRPAAPAVADDGEGKLVPRKAVRQAATVAKPDRLLLSGGGGVSDREPSLRLATELTSPVLANDGQRDILRLEFRMLMALHEQATSQLSTAEKLRNMEGTLLELQAQAAQFAQRVEKDAASASPPATALQQGGGAVKPDSLIVPGERARPNLMPAAAGPDSDASWTLYGLGLGALLGLLGWLGWRRYQERKAYPGGAESDSGLVPDVPEVRVDPRRLDEQDVLSDEVDLPVEPVVRGSAAHLDLDLDLGLDHPVTEETPHAEHPVEPVPSRGPDSVLSISATTLDEHFEANPVMELADIMLSFGRVKGAAQALQEFIDHNPEEALRPWIRLMDVYRMAGMRTEFETVARDLNRHFNVEVQSWEGPVPEVAAETHELPIADASRASSLEEMPRLMNTVITQWGEGDVVGYLYQLLRDNRGGQRQGFALPVVEDILFLIELKETANRME